MTEQQLQRKITQWLKSKEIYHFKVISANKKGVPDVIACVDGLFVAIEVKLPSGRVSELQDYNIEQITGSGGLAFVARSLDYVKNKIEGLL